jgi:hypothetical protein
LDSCKQLKKYGQTFLLNWDFRPLQAFKARGVQKLWPVDCESSCWQPHRLRI